MSSRTALFLVLAIGASIVSARAQAPSTNTLFLGLSPAADASDNVQSIMKELSTLPGYVSARVVATRPLADLTNVLSRASSKMNPAAEQPANQLVIQVADDRTVRAVGRSGKADLENGRWYGDVVAVSGMSDDAAVGAASFTIRDGKLLGTVAVPGATYEIRPVGNNLTSIVQLDARKAPPDHPPPDQRYRKGQSPQDQGPVPTADPNVTYKLRVIVAYTPAAKTVIGGPGGLVSVDQWVDQRINEANQSHTNSNINVEMELAKVLPLTYTETGSWDQDRDRFFQNNDGHMDTIFAERDSAQADVAILLFKNSTYCGEAMAIRATAANAFAVVDTNPLCTVKFTFVHEVGHLFGAEHDIPNASNPSSYPWAHGFINGNAWRTMMAYQTNCDPCTRLPYWSSPLIKFKGVAMGTADKQDNARVLRENAKAMSEFK